MFIPRSFITPVASASCFESLCSPLTIAVAPTDAFTPASPYTPVIVAKSEKLQPTVLAIEPAILIVSNKPSTSVFACACAFAIISV